MLTAITDGVWTVRHAFEAPGLKIPLNMQILRADDGGLVLYSPVPLEGDLPDQIAELGEVQHILAPSRFHHLHVPAATKLFPQARLWGAKGLREKRKDLSSMTELPDLSPWPGIDVVHIQGAPILNEVCLHHRAGSTLAVCDLVFNMKEVGGWFGVLFTHMTGTYQKLAMSRSWHAFARRKSQTVASIAQLVDYGAERVLMGHGDPLTEAGTERLREVIFLR